jgi:CRISPR-associated protein Cas1
MSGRFHGADKPELQELPRIGERLSFLYLERCVVNRSESAITVTDRRGTVCVPAAMLGVIVLGPGSNITHRAVELLGDAGASIIWAGERGVRYYAHGRPLTHSSRLLVAQAKAVSNTRSRLDVARRMYMMRFPDEDVSRMTMQQLRGREGARVRTAYRRLSKETGVEWKSRNYDPDDFDAGDTINMAISAANSCLYGMAHCAIVAIGCSPGLGFIHTGREKSFVYDIADLYKTEISLPIAFRIAAETPDDVGTSTRIAFRDAVVDGKLMERMVRDIRNLLLTPDEMQVDDSFETSTIFLWDDKAGMVEGGISYAERDSATEL